MMKILDAQLKRLKTDRIDYYLIHSLTGSFWSEAVEKGVTAFLDEALASGRILNAGFSFHGLAEDFTAIVDAYDWTFCQIQYNFLDTRNQAGTAGLEYAASKDLAVVIMEPLREGTWPKPRRLRFRKSGRRPRGSGAPLTGPFHGSGIIPG